MGHGQSDELDLQLKDHKRRASNPNGFEVRDVANIERKIVAS
jgi:hypothetical protein